MKQLILAMHITTEFPIWFIPCCLLAGLIGGALLYYRNNNDELPASLKKWLFALRTVTISFIAFLLLGPTIRHKNYTTIKPVIAIAIDGSSSMKHGMDSTQQKQLLNDINNMGKVLSNHFDVQYFTFGSAVLNQPCDSFYMASTNMGNLFETTNLQYKNDNLGAIVVISDGINNEGNDPLYAATPIESSIYTVGVGDTTQLIDISIANINYNRSVYKGNFVPIQIMLQGTMAAGSKSKLSIKSGDRIIEEKAVVITNNRFFSTQLFHIKVDSAGIYRFRIELDKIDNEQNINNNMRDIVIEVLDHKQKALIVANIPHPDVSMLKEILEKSSFEVESTLINDLNPVSITTADVLILHSLPSLRYDAEALFKSALQLHIPILFIIGNNTNLTRFNNLQTGLAITQQSGLKENAFPFYNQSFSSFLTDNTMLDDYTQLPPLVTPFGEYKTANSVSVLFYQKIGNITTNYPLIAFNNTLTEKYGFICGEGIWRWRLDNFRRNNNSNAINELVTKSIQVLLSVDKNKRFKVYCDREYRPYEHAIFRAEFYNQAQEPTTESPVALSIFDEQHNEFEYNFGIENNSYKLDAGTFSPGTYKWSASVNTENEKFTEQGSFSISSFNVEKEQIVANHYLLKDIAAVHNGQFVSISEINKITEILLQRTDLKPVRKTIIDYFPLINIVGLLFILLSMIFTEWFLRKYNGSY
jgi:hypothetical protein